jgi:Flp pilus assembly protein TadD
VILAAFFALLFGPNLIEAAAGQSLSGRLVFENLHIGCDTQCTVTLMASGVRPVQTVFPDLAGNFTFSNVLPGPYTIRVEIGGVEVVNQPVDALGGPRIIVMVPMSAAAAAPANGPGVVNLSEFSKKYPKKAVSYFEKGSGLLKKKDYDQAVKYLRGAVELAPTFYQAQNELGVAYFELGRRDDAEYQFLVAQGLNSTNIEPLLRLTRLYLDENDTEQALKASEQAIKVDSGSAPAFLNLGIALFKATQLERAETALKRALDLAPKMGAAHLMLANVYLKLQRYDRSVDELNIYIAENPRGDQLQAATEMRDRLVETRDAGKP